MRICIAYSSTKNKKIVDYAKSLGSGIGEQLPDALIDFVDIDKERDKRLTGYKYLIFGCSKSSLFNFKVDSSIKEFIRNCGQLTGKHTFVYTVRGFGSRPFLIDLMNSLEAEGVLMKNSADINSKDEAKIIGKKLNIK